jgi:hypothetical protein
MNDVASRRLGWPTRMHLLPVLGACLVALAILTYLGPEAGAWIGDFLSSSCSQNVPLCTDCLAAVREDSGCPSTGERCILVSDGGGTIYQTKCVYSGSSTDICYPWGTTDMKISLCNNMKAWDCECVNPNGQPPNSCSLGTCSHVCEDPPDHTNQTIHGYHPCV